MSLNYPYIVFGGNSCGLKNVFDSSMINEPSWFEPLKFYCIIPICLLTWRYDYPWLDLSISRTNSQAPKDVRAIEVRQCQNVFFLALALAVTFKPNISGAITKFWRKCHFTARMGQTNVRTSTCTYKRRDERNSSKLGYKKTKALLDFILNEMRSYLLKQSRAH